MGCQSSTQNVHQNSSQVKKKRFIQSGFPQQIRQQLLDAIQWNDSCDFAVAADEHNIPINAELSQNGFYWMATHYCCRWNAYKVLDYVLKSAYFQDPKKYARYINQQTFEGFSCLHLCVIWNSPQCFQLLLKFGGINLSIKDVTEMTPYLTAINYKRTEMKQLLKQYDNLGLCFLNVEHQRLASGDILALETGEDEEVVKGNGNNKKSMVSQVNSEMQNMMDDYMEQANQQLQLEVERMRVEMEKEIIQLELKKIEEQQARKQKAEIRLAQEQKTKKKKQRQLQQGQKKLLEQMSRKEQQLTRLKQNINKISQQKQQNIIKKQAKKSQEFLLKNEAQLKQKNQLKKTIIEQQKESVIKARVERGTRAEANAVQIKDEVSGKLPQQLQRLYSQAKSIGVYIDQSFPQTEKSIGSAAKAQKFISDLIWLRPKDIFKGDYQLFDGIDPNDIKQGSLGVCYMLATLSTLAQFPSRITDLFVFHDKALGFYVIKMLIHGEVKYITVDDAIPCSKSTKSPLFAKPNGNELWVCLVEKAWAKCIGSYMKAESMTPNHLMQDLTMCPSFGAWFKDKTQKTKDLDLHIRAGDIVVLTSSSDKKIQGIVNGHAYSLLNVYENQGKNLYKVRNPWGKFQWKGQYHDSSQFWTEPLKKKVNWVNEDDGVFFLSENQLLEAFVYYSISITRLPNKYSYTAIKTSKNESKYFTFQLQQDQDVNLRFMQKFNRMLDDPDYKYSPVVFEVGKIEDNGEVTFLTQGDNSCFWGAKSVYADPELMKVYKKGRYFVRLAVQWLNETKYNTGVFAVYAKQTVDIKQLTETQGQKYWKQLMKSFAFKKTAPTVTQNMQYIMTWMRAQMVCLAYAKETQNGQTFQSKWTFNSTKFTNCVFGLNNVSGSNDIKFIIGKGKKKANVGTLNRLAINQACTSGQVFISASLKEETKNS